MAKFKHPTHQISFHTEKELKTLSFISASEVRDEERQCLVFTYSLIEYIGRQQKLKRAMVVKCLGEDNLKRIYKFVHDNHI
jgi:hypothetical protein